MLNDKIKNLFQFIDFLNSNIENFKIFDNVVKDLDLLGIKRSKLIHQKNFYDKLEYNNVKVEINQKFKIIDKNIIQLIRSKSFELNICDRNKPDSLEDHNISEINNFKRISSEKDIPEILNHKRKYIEFRTETNCTYFQSLFFSELDNTLKGLFDFFKEGTENEFAAFESKIIQDLPNNQSLSLTKIQFDSPETKDNFFIEIKGFFPGKEDKLLIALNGERISEKLLFPANQNKFVEVFRRLIYNNKLVNNYTEARDWICINFQFHYKRGVIDEARDFNPSTVYDGLKGKGSPSKGKRILELDWLPYQSKDKLRKNE